MESEGMNKTEINHPDVKFKSPRYKWFGSGAFNIFDQRGLSNFRQEILIHLNVLKQVSQSVDNSYDLTRQMKGHDWIIHDGHYYCLNSFNGNESNSSITVRMSLDDEKVGKRNSRKEILSRPPLVVEYVP